MTEQRGNPYEYMSARGKNLTFLTRVFEILQFENDLRPEAKLKDLKSALKEKEKIRKIYELIPEIWPSERDLNRILQAERGRHSALYTGSYENEDVFKGIFRHSLYAEKILLVDPFIYPRTFRPELDPVNIPEQYANTTLSNLLLWFEVYPWIIDGIVNFIRSPDDYDARFRMKSLHDSKAAFDGSKELQSLLRMDAQANLEKVKDRFDQSYVYNQSDASIARTARKAFPNITSDRIQI